jgi:hypothetical protein
MIMIKSIARLATASMVLMLALPTAGCRQNEQPEKNGKGVDIQIDARNTKVKVQGSKKPGDNGKHIDVDVDRHPGSQPDSGDKAK